MKDLDKVMEDGATDQHWKNCFSQIAPGLLLFARQWTNSVADAEDVVQEAFVRFWKKHHNIQNRALLYATVRSIALDFLRRDNRRSRRESRAIAETQQWTQPQFAAEDESQIALATAVQLLPDEQRQVLVMKIWNELTFAEIAEILAISPNTAASRYRYALESLKKNLVPQ
jgi:RNA polymerase sigma-70 factor (ECF subfamily)